MGLGVVGARAYESEDPLAGHLLCNNGLLSEPTEQDPEIPVPEPNGRKSSRVDALAAALERKFDMAQEDATEVARIVDETFGTDAEVNDDNLDPETRSIFYTLEAKRLLSFRREEYEWETGEKRRAFYWRVRHEELNRMASEDDGHPANETVYDSLPAQVWRRINA
ncbi:MAG TPA: hypothetical protein VM681_02535 [Candidatus Thermoplasmatota archaeon]|nr:hypothetical protein [Candidatus Thermoplasmatota archaeon]